MRDTVPPHQWTSTVSNRGGAWTRPILSPRRRQALSLLFALLAHGVVLAAVILSLPDDTQSGGGGEILEAISVEVVQSDVLEAQRTAETKHVAAANAAAMSDDGNAAATQSAAATAPVEPPKDSQKVEDVKTQAPPVETPTPTPFDIVVAPPAKPDPAREAVPTTTQDVKTPQPAPEIAPQPAQVQGGATARGTTGTQRSEGRAAASPGALKRFANDIRAALSRTKPVGRGQSGIVIITFAVASSGALDFADVTKSSGNNKLDQVALAAIRKASFPVPPDGMTEKQRTFVIPFTFQ